MFRVFACLIGAALVSGQAASPTIDLNRYPPQPQETICGDIVNENLYNNVVQCLTSVPFNPAVALRFIRYVNQTFQFQADIAYIRSPPAEYQQPPFDFFGQLQAIEDRVNAGKYHNQYAFEIDAQGMLQRLHDSHVTIYGGISSQMTFLNEFNLVSVSADGKQLPEIYIYEDLIESLSSSDYAASPVVTINETPVVEYLTNFSSQQSFGLVEPNADWNQLMYSGANEVFGLSSFSDSAPFYPGDKLDFQFKNGSNATGRWFALYESPGYTGPLETGGDFYNLFVLGILPANFDEQASAYWSNMSQLNAPDNDSGTTSNETSWNNVSSAYPADTMIHQSDLGQFDNPYAITGYFLANSSTAVLSIPSFAQYGDSVNTFSQALGDFVGNATDRNAQHIIIDLQQNQGGLVALAFFTFDAFFPNQRPFAGSRMREHPLADALGETLTSRYDNILARNSSDDDLANYIGLEWVVTDRINAQTSRNFSSWTEYRGPVESNGDSFTLTQRYDLSNPTFVEAAFDVDFDPCFYTASCDSTQQWKPEQIVLLTDGICGSTCSLFVEMMQQAGVRSVVMGGLPKDGPMQAASGTRGALQYDADQLDSDFSLADNVSTNAAAALSSVTSDTGIYIVSSGFTLRDQIRQNATVPNQVLYLPADCRLFWTFANFRDYERLWTDVYDAMFVNPSLCVASSTNVTMAPVRPPYPAPPLQGSSDQQHTLAYYISHPDGVPSNDSDVRPPATDGRPTGPVIQFCEPGKTTRGGGFANTYPCRAISLNCGCRGGVCAGNKVFNIRTKSCQNSNHDACDGPLICNDKSPLQRTQSNSLGFRGNIGTQGFCEPNWGTNQQSRRCNDINENSLDGFVKEDPDSDIRQRSAR